LGLLLSMLALALVRRLSRRFDALTQSYWELRYEHTRLRSHLARLDPADPASPHSPSAEASPGTSGGGASVTFVPLSTIRKKEK
jgi:hypothetical protein